MKDKWKLPFLLVILFILFYRVDIFLRRKTGEEFKGDAGKPVETVREGWDQELFAALVRLFLPKWKKEIFDQRRIIAISKDVPDKVITAYLAIAKVYEKKEKYKAARDTLNQILDCYPDNPLRKKAYIGLASIHEKEGNFTQARKLDELFIYEFPDDSEVVRAKLRVIDTYEKEGKNQKAAEGYEEFLGNYSKIKNADYLFFKTGLLYRKTGNTDKAEDIFSAVSGSSDKILAANARGEIWLKKREGMCPKNTCYVRAVSSPPAIDGKLDEDCWTKADKVSSYLLHTSGGKPEQLTESFVLYDKKCIYIASVCYESKIAMMKAFETKRDGRVWCDNSVEYFIDTNRDYRSYYQFIVNSISTVYDKKCKAKGDCTADWDCQWQAKSWVGGNLWTCEIAIPFSSLNLSSPQKGDVWGINFCRNSYTNPWKKEHSAWSGPAFHNPESLGYMIFD